MKTINPQTQEGQQTLSTRKVNKTTASHIIIEQLKTSDVEKILKIARGVRHIRYREAKIRMIADFSSETTQARRQQRNIFKVLKKNCQP